MDDRQTHLPPPEPYGPAFDQNGFRKQGAGTPNFQSYAGINRFDSHDDVQRKMQNAFANQRWAEANKTPKRRHAHTEQGMKWWCLLLTLPLSIWGFLEFDAHRRGGDGGVALFAARLALPGVRLEPADTYLNEPFPLIRGDTKHFGSPEAYRCVTDEACRRGMQEKGAEFVRSQFSSAQWFLLEKAVVRQSDSAAKDACLLPLLIPSPTPVRSARNFCNAVVISTSAKQLAEKWNSMLRSSFLLDAAALLEPSPNAHSY